ncbi:hypothetical protein AAVH_24418 [Aphelenchoides avenae]|nr:hypothetical protein AAVH_24418 [Aphelenchus avenae]
MYWVELQMVREYFCSVEQLMPFLKHGVDLQSVSDHFLFVWNTFEIIVTTMRNRGFNSNQMFFMDESFCYIRQEEMAQFYQSNPVTPHAESLARHAHDRLLNVLSLAKCFRQKELDDVELASFRRLIFARYEADLFRDQSFLSQYRNEVLRDLYEYYNRCNKDYIAGLDKIMLLMEDFHQTFVGYCEHMTNVDVHCPEEKTSSKFSCLSSFRRRKRIDYTLN